MGKSATRGAQLQGAGAHVPHLGKANERGEARESGSSSKLLGAKDLTSQETKLREELPPPSLRGLCCVVESHTQEESASKWAARGPGWSGKGLSSSLCQVLMAPAGCCLGR